ncbi:hypothetical protein F5Y17DRAFT_316726 [Xylariaceae sp. FL0594]|nr:hypothetical protein F5Y17DRAFT_316726 [Xylariaceae sp. FL0594]
MLDDIDAITPCPIDNDASNTNTNTTSTSTTTTTTNDETIPIEEQDRRSRRHRPMTTTTSTRSSRSSSSSSSFENTNASRRRESLKAIEAGTDGDPDRLWRRMLGLQQRFGCYNSARMSAALSSGNFSVLRPSKACLDLLNENMMALPETVVDWLRPN